MSISNLAAAGVFALALSAGAAFAADAPGYGDGYNAPSSMMMSSTSAANWDGLYMGLYGGGLWSSGGGSTAAALGGIVGVNTTLGSGAVAGVEGQLGVITNGSASDFEGYLLGRLGVLLSNDAMLYGTAGFGSLESNGVFAVGGGLEMAVNSYMSVRGEVLGIGAWNGGGVSVGRATVGVLWHY
ncbi:MAG TPA: hypothetical protein VIL84_14895 [Devosiaceae bacterium]